MTTAYNEAIPYNSELNYNGGQPIITPSVLPTFGLKVISKTGTVSPLPEAQIDSVSFEDSAVSSISINLASTTVGASLVGDLCIFELNINGKPIQDGRWVCRGQNWNEGNKAQVKTFTGRHLLWDRLEHTIVWNDKRYLYSSKTPGFIMNDLFTAAQTRDVGYWDNFTWTFDAVKDSAGRAWPTAINIEYLPSAKYSDVIANLVDKGILEIHLTGNEIQAYVPDTFGRVTPVLLVVGEDVTDAPQQSSADNLVSHVLVLGDENISVTRSDPTTASTYWREEQGISQGGTKDEGTLSVFGDVALSGGDRPRVQRTYELVLTQERQSLPIRDYIVGDWVRTQHATGPAQSFRVKQITLKRDNGRLTGSLVLNDKFVENELRLVKKVDGIIGGATITGSSQTSTGSEDDKDTTVPNPPTGVVGSATPYIDGNGVTKILAQFSWTPPLTNTDGSVVTDIDFYRAAWKYADLPASVPWTWRDTDATSGVDTNTIAISPLDPGRQLLFYVRAIDKTGHWSGNQPVVYVLDLGTDTIPPLQPSMPVGSSVLKTLVAQWDGLDLNGNPPPVDFDHIEVWSSPVNSFGTSDASAMMHGTMAHAGLFYITSTPYEIGQTVYLRFVALDHSGNRSPLSATGSTVMTGVTGPDITAGSITTNELAVGSVKAQNIDVGAVNAQKITFGQTVNLVPDPSFDDPVWRARRIASAEQPSRWFFTDAFDFIKRNGYYLQALSQPDGVNGGRMYVTDWINTQLGESYYFGVYASSGQFDPNVEATLRLGVEVTFSDGSISSDGINYTTFHRTWIKYGYRFTMINPAWTKVRFYVQAMDINAGDIIMDDWEVRGSVGTTESAGSRGLIDPLGLFAYDANDVETVAIDFRTGDVTARGTITSGFEGKRTEVNPGSTYLPEIRFYPSAGSQYAYINAVDGGGGTTPFIGVNAPDSGGPPQRAFKMILTDNNMMIGEYTKDTIVNTGTAIHGDVGDGYLYFVGKVPFQPLNTRGMVIGGRFATVGGVGSGGGTTTLTVSKPTMDGLTLPMYSLMRLSDLFFNHHLRGNSSANWQIRWENHPSDGVATYTTYLMYRGDDL